MRASLGLLTCMVLVGNSPIHADDPTEKMIKMVVRDTAPGMQPGFRLTTIYQAGTKLVRVERMDDAGKSISEIIIFNNTDFWMINMVNKTALHQEEMPGFSMSVNNVGDSKCWKGPDNGPKQGQEVSYFKEHRAKDAGREKIGATECIKQTLDEGDVRYELWVTVDKSVPFQMRVLCEGKLIREMQFEEYSTGLKIKPELFQVPAGINVIHEKPKCTAPIVYENLMLVLVGNDGVAAVAFPEQVKNGVKYRYRYQSKDGKTTKSGEGVVVEKEGVGKHSDVVIKAGPLELEWSHGGEGTGWIYYSPEEIKVHLAHADGFADSVNKFTGTPVKKLDLKRFMK